MNVAHLARRFVWSLSNAAPDPDDEKWLVGLLNDRETHLYTMMSNQDRRHAIICGRAMPSLLGDDVAAEVIVASALHDVGKTPARLGTIGRAIAMLLRPAMRADDRWIAKTSLFGRMRKYTEHPAIGAEQLRGAGSADVVVAWALEHHLESEQWTIEPGIAAALAEADDW